MRATRSKRLEDADRGEPGEAAEETPETLADAIRARMDTLMANLVPRLPENAMVTFGAGEHTNWAHRYFPTQRYASMISARNGSMGYSVPSAIAASLLTIRAPSLCAA